MGQGLGAWQGQGLGAWQGQGLGAWQGQGLGARQGQGRGARQGQGRGARQGQGRGAWKGQGRGAWQGQGRGAWQGQGRGAWQGQGGGAWQSQGCTFPGNSNCINEQQSKYRALKFQQKHTKNNIRVNPISRFSNGGTWPKSLQSRANVTELCNHKSDKASSIVTEQAGIKQCDENGEVGTKCGISNVKCNKLDMVDRGENITLGENGASQERDNGESAIMFNETEVQCDEVQHHSCMHDSEDVKQDKSQNCQQSTNSLESAINTEDCKLLDGIAHDQAIKILETSDSNKNTSFKKDNLSEEEDECCILTSRKLFCPSLNSTVIFEDANELPAILKSGENTVCNKTEEQCDEMQCDEDQRGEDQRGEVQRDEVQHHSNIHDSEDVKNDKNHNSQQNIKSLEPAINTEDCNLLGGIAHDQAIEILETSDSNKSASFKKKNSQKMMMNVAF
ncbi:uncharacterized protein [Procambarus clarkii]|uniref:uncharacterized protein n=1 Tax=Procambarus clarkii TaxID=6728 RepID=UPI003742E03A